MRCWPTASTTPARLAETRWWGVLPTHRERRLHGALVRHGGPDLATVGVPRHLQAPAPERVLAEEEPRAA